MTEEPAPAAEEPLPEAAAVIARFVDAIGGPDALASVTAFQARATQQSDRRQLGVSLTWSAPDSLAAVMSMERDGRVLRAEQGTDGLRAWGGRGDGQTFELHGLRRLRVLREAEILPSIAYDAPPSAVRTVAAGTIDGRDVVAVRRSDANGVVDHYYFDADSGLLVRHAYDYPTVLGPVLHEVDFSDWRDVGGLKIPHRITSRQAGESSTLTLEHVEPLSAVSPATFSGVGLGG
jgi:hypothetical protein